MQHLPGLRCHLALGHIILETFMVLANNSLSVVINDYSLPVERSLLEMNIM